MNELSEEQLDALNELEVFLRIMARIPVDEFARRKSELSEACTVFADDLNNMLHPPE